MSNGHLTICISNNCVDIRLPPCVVWRLRQTPCQKLLAFDKKQTNYVQFSTQSCLESICVWQCGCGRKQTFLSPRVAGITALQRDERWSRHFLQSSTVSGFHLSLQQRTAAHLNIIKNKQKKEMSASVVLVHKITRLFTASSSNCCRCALV